MRKKQETARASPAEKLLDAELPTPKPSPSPSFSVPEPVDKDDLSASGRLHSVPVKIRLAAVPPAIPFETICKLLSFTSYPPLQALNSVSLGAVPSTGAPDAINSQKIDTSPTFATADPGLLPGQLNFGDPNPVTV